VDVDADLDVVRPIHHLVAERDFRLWRGRGHALPGEAPDADEPRANDAVGRRRGRVHQEPPPQPAPRPRQIQRNDGRIDQPFDMMDQDEPVDMDINIALDELLGVRGPLHVVGRNLLWLLAFNAVYLGFFAFVPRTIGMAMSSILFNTTVFAATPAAAGDDSNTTELVPQFNFSEDLSLLKVWKAIEAESVQQNTAFRLHDITTVALGYLSLAIAVVFFRFLWFLSQKVRFLRSAHGRTGNLPDAEEMRDAFDEMNRLVHGLGNDVPQFGDEPHAVALSVALGVALDAMVAIVKVGVLLFLKMFLLPIVLGIALDASTMPLFGSTLEGRIAYAGRDIFSFILLHWVAGITFMLLVTVSVLQLREVAHPDLLAQMIRPQEPQPDLLGNLMHESVSTHSKRMVLSLIIYAFLLTVHVYVPVRFGISSLIGERVKAQLQLKFFYMLTPQLEVPLELLFFHLCMLALLEKYKNGLGGMQHHWLKFMSKCMGLSDRILPQHVGNFRLVGSRPVFERGRKVDPFWYDIANGHTEVLAIVQSNLNSFEPTAEHVVIAGDTKPNGERVLRLGADYIRLPIRLPGKALRSRSILLPTRIGKYRLNRDTFNDANPVIQLWEEVPGEPIARPPEGWDDLGAGGADIQGRWAWGSEKKSATEGGVAARRPFFDKDQGMVESFVVCLKLLALGILSWLAASILVCVVAATPLAVGRSLYHILRIPDRWVHDPLAFVLGFMIVFPLVGKMARTVTSSVMPVHQRLRIWLGSFHAPPAYKALVLLNTAIFWFGLAPLLLGFAYDLAFIKSTDWFAGKEPMVDRNTSILSWMGGTVLLYVWADLCILGVLTRRYRVFVFEGREVAVNENAEAADWQDGDGGGRRLTWQGKHGRVARFWDAWKSIIRGWEWDQLDEVLLLHDCAAPIVVELVWTLLFPLAALGVCFLRFPWMSGLARAILVRSVLALTCCIQVGRVWKDQLGSFFDAAHKTARDDRYLIGEILMNYND
jgi:E3 ubiquitin-protein ligase MARCH6